MNRTHTIRTFEPGIRAFTYSVKGMGVVLEQENHDKVRVERVSVTGPGHPR